MPDSSAPIAMTLAALDQLEELLYTHRAGLYSVAAGIERSRRDGIPEAAMILGMAENKDWAGLLSKCLDYTVAKIFELDVRRQQQAQGEVQP